MQDYTKVLGRTKETIKEMHALEASLTGLAKVGMTVPKDGRSWFRMAPQW